MDKDKLDLFIETANELFADGSQETDTFFTDLCLALPEVFELDEEFDPLEIAKHVKVVFQIKKKRGDS